MACDDLKLGLNGGKARRLLLSCLVLEHRMHPSRNQSPDRPQWEVGAADRLLIDEPVSLADATALMAA